MSLPRFFIDQPTKQSGHEGCTDFSGVIVADMTLCFDKSSSSYHHIANVLRIEPGEQIELVVRDVWAPWLCEIESIDTRELHVRVLSAIETPLLPFETTLVLGFCKGDTNEKVVRQATELGVTRIIPTLFARSVSRPDSKKAASKIERLRKIAMASAQQAHRNDLPEILKLQSFGTALKTVNDLLPDLIAVPWEEEGVHHSLSELIENSLLPEAPEITRMVIVIGPEGGIRADEIEQLHDIGAHSVSLGPTILRVDTAACTAIAVSHDALLKKCAGKPA
ncbi:MAG: 16S rRNA (uracil(1498)-N(3))-methyltransferase [Coriobacteriia bacterium]|nr:16S rRNA (uracil(1498)-N(3))-methyltransferase [Coriobacteriia bacterium]MCL2537436.1 16S rRNA (uracil(1498)-N(3))-methyltransferase [Coriobacteriia bacterium]